MYGGRFREASKFRHKYSPMIPNEIIWKAEMSKNTTIIVVHPWTSIKPLKRAKTT